MFRWSQGEKLALLKLIQWKLQKGKTAEQIAEELEEPLENISQICAAIEEHGLGRENKLWFFLPIKFEFISWI